MKNNHEKVLNQNINIYFIVNVKLVKKIENIMLIKEIENISHYYQYKHIVHEKIKFHINLNSVYFIVQLMELDNDEKQKNSIPFGSKKLIQQMQEYFQHVEEINPFHLVHLVKENNQENDGNIVKDEFMLFTPENMENS